MWWPIVICITNFKQFRHDGMSLLADWQLHNKCIWLLLHGSTSLILQKGAKQSIVVQKWFSPLYQYINLLLPSSFFRSVPCTAFEYKYSSPKSDKIHPASKRSACTLWLTFYWHIFNHSRGSLLRLLVSS